MKIFFAVLNDGATIKKSADRMEIVDDSLRVYTNGELIAFIDLSALVYAHIHEKTDGPKDGNAEVR